jgi:hypothetical protein
MSDTTLDQPAFISALMATQSQIRARWSSGHSFGAVLAAFGLFVALIAQISVLSGWHLGTAPEMLRLVPANAVATADASVPAGAVRFEFLGGPAVAASRGLNIATDQVMALEFAVDRVPERAALTLGWTTTRDSRRPASLVIPLPASTGAKNFTVMLRGHPQWRDNATTLAVALVAPAGSGATTLSRVNVLHATPFSSALLAAQRWFGSGDLLTAPNSAQRVLPLALWFVVASLIAFAGIAWLKREQPGARADAIVGAVIVFAVAALVTAIASPYALNISEAAWAWIAATLAIIATASPWKVTATIANRLSARNDLLAACVVSLALAALACALGGIAVSWVVAIVALLLLGRVAPNALRRFTPVLLFAPVIAAGSIMQRFFPTQEWFDGLRDPSTNLAGLVARAAGIPALGVAAFAAHRAWPSVATASRFSLSAGLATWYALIGTTLAMALPTITRESIVDTGAAWVILPLLACVALFLWPAFQTRTTAVSARVEEQKTETDLSDVVRSLFDAANSSFNHAIDTRQIGQALPPLKRMQEIAPASLVTHEANVRYALATRKFANGADSFALLKSKSIDTLSPDAIAAVAQYANDTEDYDTVLSHTPKLAPTEITTRVLAHAQLARADVNDIESARLAALATLSSHPDERTFAREIAELHLLADDWQSAQKAMALTGIDLQTLEGQIYVSRLGLRAAGPHGYVKQINDNAMWHPDLGIAHAAVGELLLSQGNANGARARFLLAMRLDLGLWPIVARIKQLNAALGNVAPESESKSDSAQSSQAQLSTSAAP